MRAVFLSDAHLKSRFDPGYRALMHYLRRLKVFDPAEESFEMLPITDLFLVGDIFDFWFSRKERIYPEFRDIVDQLKILKEQGVNVHFSEGNHDFFLRDYFSDILDMQVYEDWKVLEFDGQRVLLGHGDLVDRTNVKYLRLRKLLRSKLSFHLQNLLPLGLLWGVARWSSSMSKEFMSGAEERIAETMRSFAMERFREGYDAVILGHCHRPQLNEYLIDGEKKVFVTLGDWVRHYSYLSYVNGCFALDNEDVSLKLDISESLC
ncbi:MAG: UDP-2,3-diacylglucosamine diphosphatase [Syntrophales bacterium]|nr:UDP-2,3-diacylglucosamine diphosphatase [Syntrophales bacterium]